jgi:MATE family multidrug resistance protein
MGWGLTGVWWGIATLMGGRLLTLAVPYGRRTLFAE